MNEWEPTMAWLVTTTNEAHTEWLKLPQPRQGIETFTALYIATAAQRKMVEWQWSHDRRNTCPDGGDPVECLKAMSCCECWVDWELNTLRSALSPHKEAGK
jgi:hypothetical protein